MCMKKKKGKEWIVRMCNEKYERNEGAALLECWGLCHLSPSAAPV